MTKIRNVTLVIGEDEDWGRDLFFDRELNDRVTLELGEGLYLCQCGTCGADYKSDDRYGGLCPSCDQAETVTEGWEWYHFPDRMFKRGGDA